MDTSQIRRLFLDYFKKQDHIILPSSSLVPQDDPTLLFTSAGMVQFKKIFLGQETLPYQRVASCQRCLRAGGKHNDLENVGFTSRHHTFFEMLGNFSFGSYFKKEAITYAWEFVTKYLKLPESKLWITTYQEDQEAEDLWLNTIKIDPARFSKCDASENFWSMGDVGPCGPCSEIYYDHGDNFSGSPPGLGDPGDRYVEIYNLVFMQYNRNIDGKLQLLPNPCVDTGMGLERVAAIMQGVHNNYHIDLFVKLIKDLAKLLNIKDLEHSSLKVIADHLRACSFLIIDGIFPSNEGRGYVLRRIIRRAVRHGYKLGRKTPFLHLAVESLVKIMGNDFEVLKDLQHKISQIFLNEELQFFKTLENGIKLLSVAINESKNHLISGETAFKLYDTYGFPIDLTMDIAREYNFIVDLSSFEKFMLEQKNRAKTAMKFSSCNTELVDLIKTDFIGYEESQCYGKILEIFSVNNSRLNTISSDQEEAKIVLDVTPFYAQSGGQVGDLGILFNKNGKFIVNDTQNIGNTRIHIGKVITGSFKVGDMVTASIDVTIRNKIKANHSATHLLQASLIKILGTHVKQKGSLVDSEKLRFDFEHFKALTKEQILEIELQVNEKIRNNYKTVIETMKMEDAISKGAIALFHEKYKIQEKVRVLNIAEGFSLELCGGTHVDRTGDIGGFKIITEEGISLGVRRIEAITGEALVKYNYLNQDLINTLIKLCKVPSKDSILLYINKFSQKHKDLEKRLEVISKNNVLMQIESFKSKVKILGDFKILVTVIDCEPKYLKFAIDILKQNLNKGIIILGCKYEDQAKIIVGLTKNIIFRSEKLANTNNMISAVELIHEIAPLIDGMGGGRDDLAEASGAKLQNLSLALETGYKKVMLIIQDLIDKNQTIINN